MSSENGDEISIADRLGLLWPVEEVKPDAVVLRCREGRLPGTKCNRRINKNDWSRIQSLRDGVLDQNPFDQTFGENLRLYVHLLLCKHRHQQKDKLGRPHLSPSMQQAIEDLAISMRTAFKSSLHSFWQTSSTTNHQLADSNYRNLASAQQNPLYIVQTIRFRHDFPRKLTASKQTSRVCSMFNDIIKPLSEIEHPDGWIYWARGTPNTKESLPETVIKIGFSQDEPDKQRLFGISAKCRHRFTDHEQWSSPHARRVEALLHAELTILGHRRQFRCHGCKVVHGEWFVIDTHRAREVINYWIDWMTQHKPYTRDGIFDSRGNTYFSRTAENKFLLNSISRAWYRNPYCDHPQDQWCTCTDLKDCIRNLGTGVVRVEIPAPPPVQSGCALTNNFAVRRRIGSSPSTPPRSQPRHGHKQDAQLPELLPDTPPALTPSTSSNSVTTLRGSSGPPTPCAEDDLGVRANFVRRTLFKKKANREIPRVNVVDDDADDPTFTSDVVPYEHDDDVMRRAEATTVVHLPPELLLPDKQEVRGRHLELPTRHKRRSSAPGNVEGYSLNVRIVDERAGKIIEVSGRSPGLEPVRMSVGDLGFELGAARRLSDLSGVHDR